MIERNIGSYEFILYSDYAIVKKDGEQILRIEKYYETIDQCLDDLFKVINSKKGNKKNEKGNAKSDIFV